MMKREKLWQKLVYLINVWIEANIIIKHLLVKIKVKIVKTLKKWILKKIQKNKGYLVLTYQKIWFGI